ncbi:hypothetical protein D0Z00_001896 [Geotrichum galactomycetum]|uniref:Uncharacterized protein n=1 Tax=Geotrichum galactomycetum TaxID=27317 RepID=A0ACB6V5K6_9ASCO|nr:hypothetical protein D0Z00_001896 [Geotrichum candidum]
MKGTLDHLADILNDLLQSGVSIDRVSKFLNEAETSKYNQLKSTFVDSTAPDVGFKDASFSWESANSGVSSTTDFKLYDLNVSFKTGKLNIVIGPTGSGKTSLLLALLGEMELIKGNVYLPTAFSRKGSGVKIDQNGLAESVAYCAQQAWLLNDTVKNNILFGSEFNEERYNAVIYACALNKDIEIWEAGDATEIGEKGIALSGGQKQRVSLARAIYSNSKHLLLDDCLSAVDSHTGIWIYKNCITGPLCFGRTIILVSHNVALTITQASFVVALNNGRVAGQGSVSEIAAAGLLGMSVGVIQVALAAGSIVLLISAITPGFLLIGVFISIFYWITSIYYLATSRELKRFNSISMSPLYQHFGETLSGIPTIRAYGLSEQFAADNLVKIDDSFRALFYLWITSKWLSFRIDSASVLVSFTSACLVVLGANKIDAGLAGVSLSYALTFSNNILWVVRIYSNLEMSMNAVERIQEYIENEPENEFVIPDSRPPANWPSRGEIEVTNLSLRYAPDLPRVIEDVTFKVNSFNKIGIVGRTGAGKSTIITSFFRFLEAETGTIKIDGIDISKIGLKDLRENMAIIPQDPILFVGTIRSNLDPFDQYTDDEVYAVLRRVNLIKANENVEDSESSSSDNSNENINQFKNLNSTVTEGGANLSQGQRQLICLARSILKSPKLLFLDEATASIDYESDALIQRTIREEFSQATILTIAHRLRSIIDYDKILVLDAGHVAEFDSPYKLLLDKKSIFYSMCENSGELDTLIELAKEAKNA